MKNRIIILSILFLLWMTGLFNCSAPSSESKKEKEQSAPVVNELPEMVITLLDGTALNVKKLEGKTVLIFFQPDCDHCQREAAEIEQNLVAFRNTKLYFVTSNPLEEIEIFAKEYRLMGHPNVYFGWTPTESVINNFGPISAPSLYIYSSEHRLIKAFTGEVKIATVLKYI